VSWSPVPFENETNSFPLTLTIAKVKADAVCSLGRGSLVPILQRSGRLGLLLSATRWDDKNESAIIFQAQWPVSGMLDGDDRRLAVCR